MAVAILLLGRSAGAAAADARMAARGVVAQLVEAMRRHDAETFVTLVTLPFVVDGFDMVTGAERGKCAAIAESQSTAHTLRFRGKDLESVRSIAGCLSFDTLLLEALPSSGALSWPDRLPKNAAGKTAALSKIAAKRMPRLFRRHANELKLLYASSQFLHLTATDNNGLTAEVAFVVTTQEPPRVARDVYPHAIRGIVLRRLTRRSSRRCHVRHVDPRHGTGMRTTMRSWCLNGHRS